MGHKSSSPKKLQVRDQQQLPAWAKGTEKAKLTSRKRKQFSKLLWREVQKEDWNMPGDKDVMDVENKIKFISHCCSRQKKRKKKEYR